MNGYGDAIEDPDADAVCLCAGRILRWVPRDESLVMINPTAATLWQPTIDTVPYRFHLNTAVAIVVTYMNHLFSSLVSCLIIFSGIQIAASRENDASSLYIFVYCSVVLFDLRHDSPQQAAACRIDEFLH